jgi:sugar phosphate isomerase/epimerase
MQRRLFLQSAGAALAALIARQRKASAATPARLDRIGLELYAVRRAMAADPERTLAAIRAIGYTDVELLWQFKNFGRSTQQVRAALDREGLRAPSAHLAPELLIDVDGWKQSIDTAKALGHEYLIVPSLPSETNTSIEAWQRWADRFNSAGRTARSAGLWLAFHNEPDHMKPIGEHAEIPYDMFVSRLDPSAVRLQLDVGNMLLGGGDPSAYLARYTQRYWSFHLKDTVPNRSKDTELGTGIFDFRKFLTAVPDLSRKPCYVEQETPVDEMISARKNFEFLRALTF